MDTKSKIGLAKAIVSTMESISEEMESRDKVIKTVPATREEVARFKELYKLAEQGRDIEAKIKSLRKGAWAAIEERLENYSTSMRFNDKNSEIEFLETNADCAHEDC